MIPRFYRLTIGLTAGLFLLTILDAFSQTTHVLSASQAAQQAMKHSIEVKNALLDIRIQQQTNREFTAITYPQLNASMTLNRFFDIPVNTIPDFISPSVYQVLVNNGVKDGNGNTIAFPADGFGLVPARFGTNWTASGGIDISQILFDGQVFVGLKARSATLKLAEQNMEVTKETIKANVYKMYYQLLVGKQQATSIDANITRFENLLRDTRAIHQNGLAEKLDVDKVEVQLNNLKTEKVKIENQLEIGQAALKFMLQLPQKDTLVLSDTLSEQLLTTFSAIDSLTYENRPEIRQLNTALKLGEYNIQRFQLSRIPTLVAFGSFSKNAQRNTFNFFNQGPWFSTSLVGIKLNAPLFDGNARRSRINKAKLELQKTKNTYEKVKQAIDLEYVSAQKKMESAMNTLATQKSNVTLAEKVYNTTKLKYEQGLGSNLEIYSAQTELKMAQNNFYGALYDAVIAGIDFQKAIGKLP